MNTNEKKGLLSQIRWEVFIPSFLLVAGAAVMGLLNNDKLAAWSKLFFHGRWITSAGYINSLLLSLAYWFCI